MPRLLFTLAFLSCSIWVLGDHAVYWLDIEAVALSEHRALFGVIYSCIIVAFPLFLPVAKLPRCAGAAGGCCPDRE